MSKLAELQDLVARAYEAMGAAGSNDDEHDVLAELTESSQAADAELRERLTEAFVCGTGANRTASCMPVCSIRSVT